LKRLFNGFERFRLALVKMLEMSAGRKRSNLLNSLFQDYLKLRDASDSQSSTEVLYHQKSFQICKLYKVWKFLWTQWKKIRLKFQFRYREIVNKTKWFHSVTTSMAMLTPNLNPC